MRSDTSEARERSCVRWVKREALCDRLLVLCVVV